VFIHSNASVFTMDFTLESGTVFVDGILKIVDYLTPMFLFHKSYVSIFGSIPFATCSNKPALFVSGKVVGSGYIALIAKYIHFVSSPSPALTWSGPTLVLKMASALQYSRAIVLHSDIIFENAELKSCASSPFPISTTRDIYVRNVLLDPHEILYRIEIVVESAIYPASAVLWRDVTCTTPITIQSR
jgi:hypothetical protein